MRPPRLEHHPAITPQDHAVESRSWGEEFACYLVSYDGRYYAWTVRPWDDGDQVFEMPDAGTAREFLAAEFARMLMATEWGNRVAGVTVGDDASGEILFCAEVHDGAEDGIWLAVAETDGPASSYALAGFDDLAGAVEEFAARTSQAADQIERTDIGWPRVAAAQMRYLAASARAGAARAVLGDIIRASRGRIRAERAVSRVAGTAGVSREFLYHVLAGDDWTWKGLMPARKSVLPPPRAAGQDPAVADKGWTAWLRFAIEAPGEREARAIADAALGTMENVVVAGQPVAVRSGNGFWTVTANLDLSGVRAIEPDNAQTRLAYLTGLIPDQVTWLSRVSDRRGTFEWPPSFWDRRPGPDDQLLHPAIRAAIVHVSAGDDT
jgi:hypothetical protein